MSRKGDAMTPKLTEDQRHAIEERGAAPIYIVDETTNIGYVLVRAEHVESTRPEGSLLGVRYETMNVIQ
jgi:hypothetical protein